MQETPTNHHNTSFNNYLNTSNYEENNDSQEIINNYLIKETIGSGTFAKVKLAQHIPTNTTYAIKILIKDKIPERDLKFIQRELTLQKEFSHPNIIKLIEIFETVDKYFIVTEFCENGELYNIIVNNTRLSNDVSALFYYQLICGLEYIHNHNIVHRDIKPENLLITQSKYLKIIDFGLSNYIPEDGLLQTPCGSPCYASPEMVSGGKYGGIKHDIWSTGVVLYAMLCGYLPFEEENNELLFKKIMECDLEYPDCLEKDAKSLMQKILINDYEERLSIEQIKEEPFYILGKQIYESIERDNMNDNENINTNNSNDIHKQMYDEQDLIYEELALPGEDVNHSAFKDSIYPGNTIREVIINVDNNNNNNNNNSIINNSNSNYTYSNHSHNNIKTKAHKPKTIQTKTSYHNSGYKNMGSYFYMIN